MRLSYRTETDTLHIIFSDSVIATRDIEEGVAVCYDGEGRISEIRVHDVVARASGEDIFKQILIDGVGPIGNADPLIILPRLFAKGETVDESE